MNGRYADFRQLGGLVLDWARQQCLTDIKHQQLSPGMRLVLAVCNSGRPHWVHVPFDYF